MIIATILIIGLLFIIGGFFFNAYILNRITKLFKVNNTNYKTALKILLLQLIFSVIAAIIISLILYLADLRSLSNLFLFVAGGYILHRLLTKYYQTDWKKNIYIYILYSIATIIISVAVTLLIVVPVRQFIVQPFYVKSASMEPNFVDNEYMLFKMWDKNYQRSEVVIFRYPRNPQEYFLKRIVGLPGEKIQIKDGNVYIFNDQNPDGYKLDESYLPPGTQTSTIDGEIVSLPDDEYFVLGDNRATSRDSRSFGSVNKSFIMGKYWLSPMK